MDDLITEFLTETSESLASLDLDMVRLEQSPDDKELISNIFRLMHTIKGTCGFLGLPRLETVAHHAENVMGRVRDGKLAIQPSHVSLIFEAFDRIKQIVAGLEATGQEPHGDDTALIEKLDAVYEGRDVPALENSPAASMPDDLDSDALQALFDSTPVAPPVTETPAPQPEAPQVETPQAQAPQAAIKDSTVAQQKETSVAAQSLRVSVDVLENLMTLVSELVLTRNQLLQLARTQRSAEFSAPLQHLNQVVSDLQEGVMKTRMQPIGNAWAKLPRIIRDLAVELNKKIDLQMVGAETELDRQVLDMIKDPLTHMVRNSADHGVEAPAQRLAAGKTETGTVMLKAYHEGGHIIIEISDDGKGLPLAMIKEKIIKNGLASENDLAMMTDQQIQQYIFKAGFSTAEQVTSVSGRGVGMDVVRTNIEKIGGSITLKSTEGKGSTFLIKIPLTLAIVSALILESGGERFAIPQLAVRELVRASKKTNIEIETIKGTPFFRLRDRLLPLLTLSKLWEKDSEDNGEGEYIVVVQVGAHQFGVVVDKVFDTEEIVVKPVSRILRQIEIFAGNTILGDGSVIMILDPNGLAKAMGETETATADGSQAQPEGRQSSAETKTSLLLFHTSNDAPKAVPLSLISRLEEIDLAEIEKSAGQDMIQYRGQLMPLVPFDSNVDMGDNGRKPVLVFTDETSMMGIVVNEIADITEEVVNVQVSGNDNGIVGSAIISGKATDVVDIGHYLQKTNRNWFKRHGDEPFGEEKSQAARILLVDDSPFFRNMLTPILRVAGYEVTALDSPIAALKIRDTGEEFDLIVSDIEMPDMNGFEFARKVREASSKWKDTPMVALTSHATQQDIKRGMEDGFSRYIAKFDRDTLLKTLADTLGTDIQAVKSTGSVA